MFIICLLQSIKTIQNNSFSVIYVSESIILNNMKVNICMLLFPNILYVLITGYVNL